jgi:peptide-methionine (S)-S-oxide reductase
VIYYHDETQKERALFFKAKLENDKVWDKPIVTEILPAPLFYPAEQYHHDYFRNNPGSLYCQSVVRPKVEKFRKVFESRLKK